MRRRRIGLQSFANRIAHVANKLNFDWCGIILSPGALHSKLKQAFFGLLAQIINRTAAHYS